VSAIVRPAQPIDLQPLAHLFDLYRQFYRQPPDAALARKFIAERFANRDSVIFVSVNDDEELTGFTQLYPTLCSVSAAKIYVLYDLFVVVSARRQGVARALMVQAQAHARRSGAVRLELATARTNVPAQTLYESLGWERDELFYRYNLEIPENEP
jgi:ribosomal protein S18 acetylase RimI-like enzyme